MNNAAALLIENGEENTALRLLEKAPALPEAWNNLGIVYMIRGELDKAEDLLNQASIGGVAEAAHNLTELAKKKEDELKQRR
ncbi:tetratricopeptide repeat protein [Bacteroides sp. 519]|nr:tetratricopeptide repeat protein [Bacteroides sp. 519]